LHFKARLPRIISVKTLLICILYTAYCILHTSAAFAQTVIEGEVVPYRPTEEITQIKPEEQPMHGLFKGKNYKIQVGFESIETQSPFSISLSENLIEYGQISPTDPVSRTNTVTVLGPSLQGYTLQVFQNHSLKHHTSQVFIPDTTCDNGICSEAVAQAWVGALTYGFGYRCDPLSTTNHCLSGFSDTSFFKPFSSETPQAVLEGTSKSSAQMTFKINISGTQAPQFYSNQITFMAVPNF